MFLFQVTSATRIALMERTDTAGGKDQECVRAVSFFTRSSYFITCFIKFSSAFSSFSCLMKLYVF